MKKIKFTSSILFLSIFHIQFILSLPLPITHTVVPEPGDVYTYKYINKTTAVDTTLIGENIFWDFRKVKDSAVYFQEIYREPLHSYNKEFDNIYSVDSSSIRNELSIWVNYLDSFGYYHIGAYEKPIVPMSDIPYIYDDTMLVLKFPFTFGQKLNDKYTFIKGGRRHYKNRYVISEMKYDAYGTLILPNNDTCYNAIRIRREERYFNVVNDISEAAGVKIVFLWYSAHKPNYFIKTSYINGLPQDAWYLKKKSKIKMKKSDT